MSRDERCPAAHPDDPALCTGPRDAVTVRDAHGTEVDGCVQHAARMLATLIGATAVAGPGGSPALAAAATDWAGLLPPQPWQHGK